MEEWQPAGPHWAGQQGRPGRWVPKKYKNGHPSSKRVLLNHIFKWYKSQTWLPIWKCREIYELRGMLTSDKTNYLTPSPYGTWCKYQIWRLLLNLLATYADRGFGQHLHLPNPKGRETRKAQGRVRHGWLREGKYNQKKYLFAPPLKGTKEFLNADGKWATLPQPKAI